MAGALTGHSASDYWSTPQRRKGESLTDYADRLRAYDANYAPPKLVEPSVPKVKSRYRVKAWSSEPQTKGNQS